MDRYQGPARLEWWANKDTCLASIDVRLLVVSDSAGWRSTAAFASPLTGEDREGWEFLMMLSPYFTLRFESEEDARIDVRVDELEEGELVLSVV